MATSIADLLARLLPGTIKPKYARKNLAFTTITLLLLSATVSLAQAPRPTESEVTAAYLYNFGKFVTWPADQMAEGGQFQICVIGKDPFGKVLESTVMGERIGGRSISIRRISLPQQAGPCHILFVSASEEGRIAAILDAAHRFNLLTVSDLKHFAERGGVIGLVVQNDRVRFEVNRSEAERCHLQLSSELLKVALRVIDKDAAQK